MYEIKHKSISHLGVSQKKRVFSIDLWVERTISVSARTKYHTSGTLALKVNLFYSPDGTNWDTVVYTSFDVTVTGGAICQRTAIVDCPEQGFISFEVENLDTSYIQTEIELWVSQSKWGIGGET